VHFLFLVLRTRCSNGASLKFPCEANYLTPLWRSLMFLDGGIGGLREENHEFICTGVCYRRRHHMKSCLTMMRISTVSLWLLFAVTHQSHGAVPRKSHAYGKGRILSICNIVAAHISCRCWHSDTAAAALIVRMLLHAELCLPLVLNLYFPAEFGVVHFDLPGRIPNGNQLEPVMLHMFIKGIQTGSTIQLRGNLFALAINEDYFDWSGEDLSQHPAAIHWRPKIEIIGVIGRQRWSSTASSNLIYAEVDKNMLPRMTIPTR